MKLISVKVNSKELKVCSYCLYKAFYFIILLLNKHVLDTTALVCALQCLLRTFWKRQISLILYFFNPLLTSFCIFCLIIGILGSVLHVYMGSSFFIFHFKVIFLLDNVNMQCQIVWNFFCHIFKGYEYDLHFLFTMTFRRVISSWIHAI